MSAMSTNVLESMEHTLTEQRKACATKSHSFDEFESIEMPLNDPIALRQGESCLHSSFVRSIERDKALEFFDVAATDRSKHADRPGVTSKTPAWPKASRERSGTRKTHPLLRLSAPERCASPGRAASVARLAEALVRRTPRRMSWLAHGIHASPYAERLLLAKTMQQRLTFMQMTRRLMSIRSPSLPCLVCLSEPGKHHSKSVSLKRATPRAYRLRRSINVVAAHRTFLPRERGEQDFASPLSTTRRYSSV